MRFTIAFATTSALAATALAAPAAEAEPVAQWNGGRPSVYTFPATCTAAVLSTSTATKYTTVGKTITSTATSYITKETAFTATSIVTITETKAYNLMPSTISTPAPETAQCLTADDAEQLAEVFRQLIQDYSTELALSALTEDFVDYSSAVNIIMNKGAQYPKNITGPTFDGRQAFMSGQGSQPKIPFERLQTFYGCDSVSVRWMTTRSGNGQKTEVAAIPVIGNGIMHVVPNTEGGDKYKFRIKELYSEFNAAAWLVNLGVFTPTGSVDYFSTANATNTTATRRSIDYDFDASLRGAMI